MSDFDYHRPVRWRIRRKIDDLLSSGGSRRAVHFVWKLIEHPRVAHAFFSSDLGKGTAVQIYFHRGNVRKAEVQRLLEALRPYYRDTDWRYIERPLEWLNRPWWWGIANRLGLVQPRPDPELEQEWQEALPKIAEMNGLELIDGEWVRRTVAVKQVVKSSPEHLQ